MSKVLIPKLEEKLSSKAYLKAMQQDADNIKEARFINPKIGKRGFGYFEVVYNTPVLREVVLNGK